MKKCFIVLMIMMGMIISVVMPSYASESTPYKEDNSSYLFNKRDGYERVEVSRVDEYGKVECVMIEDYTSDFKLLSQKSLDLKEILPTGCSQDDLTEATVYEGSNYNFILTGQDNDNDDRDLKTIRVTRFTKDWNYSAKCELNAKDQNVEVHEPNLTIGDMMERNGQLWISIGHEGFAIDGIHHQGKLNLIINIDDMSFVGSVYDLNHSFKQFLATNHGEVYQAEKAEGARCIYVEKLDPQKYTGDFYNFAAGSSADKDIFDFFSLAHRPNNIRTYDEGGNLTGFASSEEGSRLLTAGNNVNQEKAKKNMTDKSRVACDSDLAYNAWISSTSTDLVDNEIHYLTNYSDDSETEVSSGPYLMKENDHKFLAVWGIASTLAKLYKGDQTEHTYFDGFVSKGITGDQALDQKIKDSYKIQYCFVDEFGNPISSIQEMPGKLNVTNLVKQGYGDVSWCSGEGGSPLFYTIHDDGSNNVVDTNPTYDLKDVTINDVTLTYDGKAHEYPKVQNLPAGVNVKYTTEKRQHGQSVHDIIPMYGKEITAGKYPVYAYFCSDNAYAKLINDEPRVAYLTILPKDINQVKVNVTMASDGVAYFDLCDGDDELYEDSDYQWKKNGDQIMITGMGSYTGTLTINAKTGEINGSTKASKQKSSTSKSSKNHRSKTRTSSFMKNVRSDEGPKGTIYYQLQLKYMSANASSMKVGWKKIKGCQYDVYMAKCGKVFKKSGTTTKNTYTFKKLKKKSFYKVLVVAKKGTKNISISKSIHIYTGKGNTTKLKVKISSKMRKGQTIKYKVQSNQKARNHRKVQAESCDSKIIKVTKKGIKALKKGKATLYFYAQDGVGTKVTITVR